MGQELSEAEDAAHAELVRESEGEEPDAWKPFGVSKPFKAGDSGTSAVETRWVLGWKMVERVKTREARLAATGLQDPDLEGGVVDTSGCLSIRPSHLQVISLS